MLIIYYVTLNSLTLYFSADINYDGFPDVILGCPYANDYAGATYVIFGGRSRANVVLTAITNQQGFEISGAYNYDNSGAYCSWVVSGVVVM